MLIKTYSENIGKLVDSTERLTEAEINLLTKIRSKGRFDQLMEVLPQNWEKIFKVNFYDNPFEVAQTFRNEKHYKNSHNVFERTVLSVIINKQLKKDPETGESKLKYPAVPSRYDEYYQRDYDYPVEENKWKINHDLSEFVPASFHLDHKLIWTMQERSVDINSEQDITKVPYKYSINIYVPTSDVLIEVENLKRNGVLL